MHIRFIALAFMIVGYLAFAQTDASVFTVSMLDEQVKIIDRIRPTVYRIDQARLLVIRKAIEDVATDIKQNKINGRSEITFQTMRLLQYLIVQYRYSHVFLGWEETPNIVSIYTPSTAEDLQKLRTNYQKLQSVFGIDDTPYTKVTSHYFRQLEKLLRQLEALPIDFELKKSIRELLPAMARTIAIAEQGDRPKTFKAAEKMLPVFRSFYPRFNAISDSAAGFSAILEIQGLTETYAEFAQFDRPKDEEMVCP